MKVFTGPYVYRWISNVYERHMNMKYGDEWVENLDWEDRLWERFDDALQIIYNNTINLYLDNKQRKITVKIDKYDTWSMDDTLAHVILPMLKQLELDKHGAPFVDDEDVPEELKSTSAPPKENDWDTDENHFKRWDYVLSEMIWTFDMKTKDDWESEFYSGEADFQFVKDDDSGLFQMVTGPNDTFKVDRDGIAKTQKRMSNGFRLFGKYYESLWT